MEEIQTTILRMSLLKVKVKVGVIKKNEHGGRLFKEAGKEDIVNSVTTC